MGTMTMAIGRPMAIHWKNVMVSPVAASMVDSAKMLKLPPTGVDIPPITAATGIPIIRHLPRLEWAGSAFAADRMVSAKPKKMMVTQKSERTVDKIAHAAMNRKTSRFELPWTRSTSQPTKRTPYCVFMTTTGRQKMTIAKKTAPFAKPAAASDKLGATPSKAIRARMRIAVPPKGIGVVIHITARASSKPIAVSA